MNTSTVAEVRRSSPWRSKRGCVGDLHDQVQVESFGAAAGDAHLGTGFYAGRDANVSCRPSLWKARVVP